MSSKYLLQAIMTILNLKSYNFFLVIYFCDFVSLIKKLVMLVYDIKSDVLLKPNSLGNLN